MNMMMPISNRLFAAAVNEGPVARKRRGAGGRLAVIEVEDAGRPALNGGPKWPRTGSAFRRWGAGFRVL